MKTLYKGICIVLVFLATSCTDSGPVPESEYPTKVIGSWTGTVGEMKETMKLKDDSTFVCHVQHTGFISSTLSQPLTGTIKGKWKISGPVISLEVLSDKHTDVANASAASTILRLTKDSLVLKSDSGIVSVFNRVLQL